MATRFVAQQEYVSNIWLQSDGKAANTAEMALDARTYMYAYVHVYV